jgi:cytochrome c-type biogenesis protein CcmF
MGIAPFLDWQGRSILTDRDPAGIMSPLITMALTVICVGIWIVFATNLSAIPLIISVIAIGLATWTGAGAVMDVIRRSRIGQVSFTKSWRLFKKTPASIKGMQIAHLGLAIAIIGMVGSTLWKADQHAVMRAGDHISVAGYEYRLDNVRPAQGANYVAAIANLTPINGPDRELTPSRRLYPISDTTTTEASIIKTPTGGDLYAILGESQDGGQSAWIIRLYYNPLMAFLWTGGGLMVLGALMSVLSRREKS